MPNEVLPADSDIDNAWITPTTTKVRQQLVGFLSNLNVGTVVPTVASITPAGSAQASATPITTFLSILGTAASTTGVVLPPASTSTGLQLPLSIVNSGTAAVHVYGNGSDTIDSNAGTVGVTLTNGHRAQFIASSASAWVSFGFVAGST